MRGSLSLSTWSRSSGTRGQVRIVATFDGVEDQASLAPMGGQHVLELRKSVRERLKNGVGDTVQVTLRRNGAPRTFEMPPELTEALARDPDASDFFDGLAFTHRKEMANGTREAKRDETKQRRLDKAMTLLRARQKPS